MIETTNVNDAVALFLCGQAKIFYVSGNYIAVLTKLSNLDYGFVRIGKEHKRPLFIFDTAGKSVNKACLDMKFSKERQVYVTDLPLFILNQSILNKLYET